MRSAPSFLSRVQHCSGNAVLSSRPSIRDQIDFLDEWFSRYPAQEHYLVVQTEKNIAKLNPVYLNWLWLGVLCYLTERGLTREYRKLSSEKQRWAFLLRVWMIYPTGAGKYTDLLKLPFYRQLSDDFPNLVLYSPDEIKEVLEMQCGTLDKTFWQDVEDHGILQPVIGGPYADRGLGSTFYGFSPGIRTIMDSLPPGDNEFSYLRPVTTRRNKTDKASGSDSSVSA